MMTVFLMYCLATIGLANILVHGKIMDVIGLRPLVRTQLKKIDADSMLDCYECMGFWSGLLNGFIWCAHAPHVWWTWPIILVVSGWAGSVLSQTYTDVMYILRSNMEFVVEETNEETS